MVGGSEEISSLPPTIFVTITNQKCQLYQIDCIGNGYLDFTCIGRPSGVPVNFTKKCHQNSQPTFSGDPNFHLSNRSRIELTALTTARALLSDGSEEIALAALSSPFGPVLEYISVTALFMAF